MQPLSISEFIHDHARQADIRLPRVYGTYASAGCAVIPAETSAWGVTVSPGEVVIQGDTVQVKAAELAVTPPTPGGHSRLDLVIAGSDGRARILEGATSNFPAFPSVPADAVAVAVVWVQSSMPPTPRLTADHLADVRGFRPVSPPAA